MRSPTTQIPLLCPNCGGQGRFDPEAGGLACQSCGDVRRLDVGSSDQARAEYAYDPDVPREEKTVSYGTRAYNCETCGGEIVFTGAALSERCPYCDGAVVLGALDEGFETMGLIPFAVGEENGLDQARRWISKRWAAPNTLSSAAGKARVAGLYAPFWTFDSREAVEYWATYVTGSGDNRRTHKTSGRMSVDFNDLLVPASHHVTPLIRDGILHDFDPYELRPYRAGYLAGFAAERHHQTVCQGLDENRKQKNILIRNRIKRHINRSRVTSINYRTDTTGIHYRRILLPVWILHYTFSGKAYKVVVSGIDGRTFGERPFSKIKLFGFSAIATGLAMALGLGWGSVMAF